MAELRVYCIDTTEVDEIPADIEAFKTLSEELGTVYSLEGFEEAFNNGEVSTAIDIIRIASADTP